MSRRVMTGTVVSDKMEKTVVVSVQTTKRHPLYTKVMRTRKKYMAHDEEGICKEGDEVQIIESRPMSKRKRWTVVEVIRRANA